MPDIFGENQITPEENEVTASLEDLVGEGRKYKDANELAKAYAHADALIAAKKAEEVEREAELKVLRDLVNARQSKPATEEKQAPRQDPPTDPTPKVETPDLQKLVRDEINNRDAETRRTNNINEAAETLTRKFGNPSKAQEAIRSKAAEMGVGFEWLRDMAATSPTAFYRAMDVDPSAVSRSTPGFTNDVTVRPGSAEKNYSYYEGLRKTNPKLYYSAELRAQMFKSAQELGDRFYNKS